MLGLPQQVRACLFDLDGVLTDTASVHQRAWKAMFDAYLRQRSQRLNEPFDVRVVRDVLPQTEARRDARIFFRKFSPHSPQKTEFAIVVLEQFITHLRHL